MADVHKHPKQIPPYARGYDGFEGEISYTQRDSNPAWLPENRAPEGAPNIIVVLIDDLGYSDIGPFGSEIPTPCLDNLAQGGALLTNYHTTPVCSPARAALLTGLNPHRAGFASVADYDPGFPNLRLELAPNVLTLPEALRSSGYATYAVGKWHLTRESLLHDAARKDTWPTQRGFDRYYGSMEGCNSFFHPNRIIQDNSPVDPVSSNENYYLTDDLTDKAIDMIKGLRASDGHKPFFLYFSHVAMHGPLGAKLDDLAAQHGNYDTGWDVLREQRFARQLDLGLFPHGTTAAPRHHETGYEVPAWEQLDDENKQRYARYMEVYAAMVSSIDQSLTRITQTLTELGELDNTIIVFTSDNGGTNEGGPTGTRSYFSQFVQMAGLPPDWDTDIDRDLDLIGGPQTMIHYPRGWGQVSNTPFRFYKGHTHAGGVRVPFIINWPRGQREGRLTPGIRSAFQYVTDVFPTLLDLAGITMPASRNGIEVEPIDGASFTDLLSNPDHPGSRSEQYAEFGGNRGLYKDGWKIISLHQPGAPLTDHEWELYHVETDPTELNNLASQHPDKVRELSAAWKHAAWRNTVFPIAADGPEHLSPPPPEPQFEQPVVFLPGTPKIERYRASRLIYLRSFTIDAEIACTETANGILLSHGDQGGGYIIYIENQHLHFAYNEYGRMHQTKGVALESGPHHIRLSATAEPQLSWRFDLSVDSIVVGTIPRVAMMVGMAPFSGIDIGRNTGGPVHWQLHTRHGSFPYTGILHRVTYHPGTPGDYDDEAIAQATQLAAEYFD